MWDRQASLSHSFFHTMKILSLFWLLFLSLCLQGQEIVFRYEDSFPKYSIPQVFSPDASDLGRYGKTPVTGYTGLPDIKIPLTELRAKGFSLPIFLTYRSGGHHTETHPGVVGLGWTLHAGGCINRNIRGFKDEMTKYEAQYAYRIQSTESQYATENLEHPGYLFHPGRFSSSSLFESEAFDSLVRFPGVMDYEPDEFQVCVEGIQCSFFFGHDGEAKIFPCDGPIAKVEYEAEDLGETPVLLFQEVGHYLNAHYFNYIKRITLTDKQGNKYVFGGEMNNIDFSYVQTFSGIGPRFVATPNTWYLERIVRQDGEEVEFEYEKHGYPVVVSDIHTKIFSKTEVIIFNLNTNEYASTQLYGVGNGENYNTTRFQNDGYEEVYSNLSYTILHPSYLKSIKSQLTGEQLLFSTSDSYGLDNDVDAHIMALRLGSYGESEGVHFNLSSFLEHRRYAKLDRILGPRCRIDFSYRSSFGEEHISPQAHLNSELPGEGNQIEPIRLRLEEIQIRGGDTVDSGGRYQFKYNDRLLPKYNVKQSDHWGFYNGLYYGAIFESTESLELEPSGRTIQDMLLVQRTPNPIMAQAELLTEIIYPTGGITKYVYEPHTYKRVVSASTHRPQTLPVEKFTGGVRIKEIIDSLCDHTEKRVYDYHGSGILSGDPVYYYAGTMVAVDTIETSYRVDTTKTFRKASEAYQNQLYSSVEPHVVYDWVTETREDGSRIDRHYIGPEQNPDMPPVQLYGSYVGDVPLQNYTSRSHLRGKLLEETVRDTMGVMIRRMRNYYSVQESSDTCFSVQKKIISSINNISHVTVTRLPSGNIQLDSVVVMEWTDLGDSLKSRQTFSYNRWGMMSASEFNNSLHCEERRMVYSGDLPPYGDYGRMQSAWILDRPVEETVLHDGAVVSSVLTTWRQEDSLFVPDCHYEARLWEPFTGDWPVYEGIVGSWQQALYGEPRMQFDRYDAYGNVLELTEEGAVSSQYYWSPDGVHPEASFRQMVRPAQRYWHNGTGHREDVFQGKMVSRYDIDFTADYAGPASLDMMFHNGLGYSLSGVMDGDTVFHYVCPSRDVILPVTTLWEGTVSAGPHRLTLSVPGDEIFPLGNMGISQIFYLEGSTLLFYPVREERVSYENLPTLYESFESGGTRSGGFHSDHSWAGARTVSLNTPYGVRYTVDWMELGQDGEWHYRRSPFSGTAMVGGGALAVDNVRVYPDGAEVQSWTWWENGELRSMTDGKGRTESYAYDGLARLVSVTDEEGNTTKAYEYQYSNNE